MREPIKEYQNLQTYYKNYNEKRKLELRKELEDIIDRYGLDKQGGERLYTIIDYLLNCIEVYSTVEK